MKDFIGELGIRQEEFRLYCDSERAIHLAKNTAYHFRTKHIQRRYHWLCKRVEIYRLCFEKDPHIGEWVGHVDQGAVSGETRCMLEADRNGK